MNDYHQGIWEGLVWVRATIKEKGVEKTVDAINEGIAAVERSCARSLQLRFDVARERPASVIIPKIEEEDS